MSIILNIDKKKKKAHVSIANDAIIVDVLYSGLQKEHASFLQPAIQQLMKNTGISLTDIDAVAVTAGPGSYTGLRVGMASAKGLCYALSKPLITINTLQMMAKSGILAFPEMDDSLLLAPMIDARRMEVFTAVYDSALKTHLEPTALILDELSYKKELAGKVLFFGSGSIKWQKLCAHQNALFNNFENSPEALSILSFKYYLANNFADLAYTAPLYLKEFQIVTPPLK